MNALCPVISVSLCPAFPPSSMPFYIFLFFPARWVICYGVTIAFLYLYLFGVLRRFQHCTGHITMGSWKGRGNQYIEFARVVYCKLPTNGKQLPAFPLKAITGIEPRPQRWEARVLPLYHRGPFFCVNTISLQFLFCVKHWLLCTLTL